MAMTILCSIGESSEVGKALKEERVESGREEIAERIWGVVARRTMFVGLCWDTLWQIVAKA